MLDFRHETFLALCKIGHYTRTANALHLTQPAVSQHIKYLEDSYGGKLFTYKDKVLTLTSRGEKLRDFVLTMSADSQRLRLLLLDENLNVRHLRFGATLSIGEFVLPALIARLLRQYPDIHITMPVDNTQVLLKKLRDGEIDFALLEGFFDKSQYACALFSQAEFIAVRGCHHPLTGKAIPLGQIVGERIILRESGSGTRDVLETVLHAHSLSIGSFEKICEMGNMSAIKRLVADNLGITFLYRAAAEAELARGELQTLDIQGFPVTREFNFVFLKNSLHQAEYLAWLDYFKGIYVG